VKDQLISLIATLERARPVGPLAVRTCGEPAIQVLPDDVEIPHVAAERVRCASRHQMQMTIELPEILDVSDHPRITVVEQLLKLRGASRRSWDRDSSAAASRVSTSRKANISSFQPRRDRRRPGRVPHRFHRGVHPGTRLERKIGGGATPSPAVRRAPHASTACEQAMRTSTASCSADG